MVDRYAINAKIAAAHLLKVFPPTHRVHEVKIWVKGLSYPGKQSHCLVLDQQSVLFNKILRSQTHELSFDSITESGP